MLEGGGGRAQVGTWMTRTTEETEGDDDDGDDDDGGDDNYIVTNCMCYCFSNILPGTVNPLCYLSQGIVADMMHESSDGFHKAAGDDDVDDDDIL